MEYLYIALALLLFIVIMGLYFKAKSGEAGGATSDTPHRQNVQDERERAKQAFYMNNFWNYDGSEQREFDE